MKTEKPLNNPAALIMQEYTCPKVSDEPLYFALRDNHHEFSLPFSTLLECLKFAENEGIIPPIPTNWWGEISHRFYLPSDPLRDNT